MSTLCDSVPCIQCGRRFFTDRPGAKYQKCKRCRPTKPRKCRTIEQKLETQKQQAEDAAAACRQGVQTTLLVARKMIYCCNRCRRTTYLEPQPMGDEFWCARCCRRNDDPSNEEIYRMAAEIRAQRDDISEMD